MTTEYQQAVLHAMSIPLYSLSKEEPEAVTDIPKSEERQRVDSKSVFVQKVLDAIGFKTLQEANLQWFIQENAGITLDGDTLVTPHLTQLQTPAMKKGLWLAIQHLRKETI
jgi:hypothetical protein